MQNKVGSRIGILAAILLCPVGSLGQGQMPLPSRALVALVQAGLEGMLPAEPLFCFACLLLMQRPGSTVLVQLTQGAGLQKKSATSAGRPAKEERSWPAEEESNINGLACKKKSAKPGIQQEPPCYK